MNNSQLQSILGTNVVELTFVRRHPKLGWSDIRGMFGTTNFPLLNGDFGSQVLHFHPPKGVGMGYNYKAYNLCVVWDMFRQEYRVFGAEQVEIRKQFPLNTPEEQEQFMQYFYDYIIGMSNQQKIDFMGYVGNMIIPGQVAQNTPDKIPNKLSNIYDKFKSGISQFFNKKP
jgi:hypothetical protein